MRGDDFSRLVSTVSKLLREEHADLDDPITWTAPTECLDDIVRHTSARLQQWLNQYGYTPAEFDAELARRTSDRWAHFSGLLLHDRLQNYAWTRR